MHVWRQKSVVDSNASSHSRIHKNNVAWLFHKAIETIAADIFHCYFIYGLLKPVDVWRKHWRRDDIWHTLQPFLLWKGDIAELFEVEKVVSHLHFLFVCFYSLC